MLDAHSGDILAMVGSADYHNDAIAGEFNVVTAQRQPGSSFKPYVYEEAFRNGAATPSSTLDDTAQESRRLGGVQDWDGNFMGPMPAAQALLLSRNVPTEQLMERAGTANVIGFAHSLGISSDLAGNASTAIGSSAVRMIDHAAAYAAFANGGSTVQPRAILRVTGAAGNLLYAAPSPAGRTVMTTEQAYAVTGILRQYNAQWGDGINRDIACKSGTTDNFTDAWFMAYSPDWVVATWVGHTSGSNPAEVGMNTVFGNDAGHDVAAPFINGLAPSPALSFHRAAPRMSAAATPARARAHPTGRSTEAAMADLRALLRRLATPLSAALIFCGIGLTCAVGVISINRMLSQRPPPVAAALPSPPGRPSPTPSPPPRPRRRHRLQRPAPRRQRHTVASMGWS